MKPKQAKYVAQELIEVLDRDPQADSDVELDRLIEKHGFESTSKTRKAINRALVRLG